MGSPIRRFISAKATKAFSSRINGLGRRPGPAGYPGPPAIPMNQGANSMSSRIVRGVAVVATCLSASAAFAIEPCHRGVPAISIEQGQGMPAPGYISPDAGTFHPDGKLQEQRWHNLHAAIRPLRVICRYANKVVPVVLQDGSSLFRVGNWGVTVVHRSISEPLMAIASGFAANSVSVEQGGPRRRSAESNAIEM